MTTRLLAFLCSLLFSLSAISQPTAEWQKCYGGSGVELFYSTERLGDGGFLLVGVSESDDGDITNGNNGGEDAWLVRTDSLGAIVWTKTYGGSDDDRFTDIMVTSDGNFVAIGQTMSNDGDVSGNHGAQDYWMVKIDPSGNLIWQKCLGGTLMDIGHSVVETDDGKYLVAGYTASNDGDVSGNHGVHDFWLVRTDPAGTVEWKQCYGGTGQEWCYTIRKVSGVGYCMNGIGTSNNGDMAGAGSNGGEEYWGLVIDNAGTVLHSKCFGGSSWDDGVSIIPTSDGGYALIGVSASNNGMVSNSNGTNDMWFVKTDGSLNMQWQKALGGSMGERGFDIEETSDGGFLLAGYTSSNDGYVSGKHGAVGMGTGTQDIWLVKLNAAGSVQWQKCLGGAEGEFSFEFHDMLTVTPSGDIYVAASTQSNDGDVTGNHPVFPGANYYPGDFWLVKLLDNANHITGINFIDLDGDMVYDTTDIPAFNVAVYETVTGNITFTNPDGNYSLSVPDSGNYSVYPQAISYYTFSPATQTAYFSLPFNQTDAQNNFAFQAGGTTNDLSVTLSPLSGFRRGFDASYLISYVNHGTTTLPVTITFTTEPDTFIIEYISSNGPASFESHDSVVWDIGNVAPFGYGTIVVQMHVSQFANVGTPIHSEVTIAPVTGDATTADNVSVWDNEVLSACDPNEIYVDIDTIINAQIASPPQLQYTIKFQNTGNDTAVNVKIVDPLPLEIDPTSIQFISASDPVTVNYIAATHSIEFVFTNIMLPDSNVNWLESHGMAVFKATPLPGLAAGTDIDNYVDIYFDFNDAVTTNTANTHVESPDGIDLVEQNPFTVYPNPASETIVVTSKGKTTNTFFVISDVSGRIVLTQQLLRDVTAISIDHLVPGFYNISQQVDGNTIATRKLAVAK